MSVPPHWTLLPLLGLDLETTGLDPEREHLLEWGCARMVSGRLEATGGALVRPPGPVSPKVLELTGLDDAALQAAAPLDEQLDAITAALEGAAAVVAYNAPFDRTFLDRAFRRAGRRLPDRPWLDPFVLVSRLEPPGQGSLRLADVCARWGIVVERPHRAVDDALAAVRLMVRAGEHTGAQTLPELISALERAL